MHDVCAHDAACDGMPAMGYWDTWDAWDAVGYMNACDGMLGYMGYSRVHECMRWDTGIHGIQWDT